MRKEQTKHQATHLLRTESAGKKIVDIHKIHKLTRYRTVSTLSCVQYTSQIMFNCLERNAETLIKTTKQKHTAKTVNEHSPISGFSTKPAR